MTQTKTQQLNPQIFTIWSDEIEGRIDPYFFSAEIKNFRNRLSKTKTVKLGEIIEIITKGETPLWRGDNYQNEGVPFLRVQNITSENIKGNIVYISEKVDKRMKRSQLFGGELLYTMAGSIGIATIFPESFGRANINQAIAKIILKSEINREYIKVILNSDLCKKQAEMALTAVAQPNINFEQIKSIKIPLPPLSIQNQIVFIMSKAYEEKKRKEKKAEEILNSIDDYVLKELKIKMPEIEKEMVFEVWSDEMEKKRIDAEYWQPYLEEVERSINNGKYRTEKLKKYITKIHYGASTSNAYVDGGIPLLRILNLKPNNLDLSKAVYLPESFRKELGNAFVKTGDLLISRSGTVGTVVVIPKEADGFAFGSFMIKFCLNDEINKEFVSIWLNNKLNKFLTEREKIGAIQGNITIGTIENFKIPIPPLLIQKKISEKIELYYFQAKKLKKEAKEVLENAKEEVEKMILK